MSYINVAGHLGLTPATLKVLVIAVATAGVVLSTSAAKAATRYVAVTGNDAGNTCTAEASPCKTIAKGIGSMASGETLIIGDGTYTDPIGGMPNGTAAAYTTIRAANDWGVLIDGSGFPDDYRNGIAVVSKKYVAVRGIRVKMNQAKPTNDPIVVVYSDHIKIQRCGGSYGPTKGNSATIGVGPDAHYILIEESYAFGGSRYQFLVYQSDHVVVRRSVARNDHWADSLQCAGFVNYDSLATTWQNNIVLDSDDANCTGRLYGGFWNENKTDFAPDTSQTLRGNIVLNVKAFYAGDLDWGISGTRTIEDMVIWGSSGGYHGDQGPGTTASINARRMTIGAISGTYDGPNGAPASGTGWSVHGNVTNTLTSSILSGCNSVGVADYTKSDFNAFSANGKNYGGQRMATVGASDLSTQNANAIDPRAASLKYLPRIEAGTVLKTAGQGGGQIGAEIVNKVGVTGTLWGEAGYDTLTAEPLWPFPNEDQIRKDMASYSGPGGAGARGFTMGTSLDGTPQTLTKYIWEYLGNQIPADIYGSKGTTPPGGDTSPPGSDHSTSFGGGSSDGGVNDASGVNDAATSGGDDRKGTTPPGGETLPPGSDPSASPGGGSSGGVNNAAPSEGEDGCDASKGNPSGSAGLSILAALAALMVARRRR